MTDAALRDLARQAGIHPEWVDYRAERRSVAPDILRRILDAMSLPADSPAQIAQSLHHLGDHAPGRTAQPLVTGDLGQPLTLPPGDTAGTRAELTLEDGRRQDVTLGQGDDGRTFVPAIAETGYHRLVRDGRETVLAVAPARCLGVEDLAPQGRAWGLTAQTYAIRRDGDGGIGDMGGVALLAEAAARHGADALALSPCHALFAAEPTRFGPYSPSSRLFLNVLHGDPAMVLGVDRVAAAVAAAGASRSRWRACR